MFSPFDTIAAVSTPFGKGGVAVIRLSGPEALTVAERVFRPRSGKRLSDYPTRYAVWGDIVVPEGADASFFLCKELVSGYLDDVTGVYQTPQGYYVDPAEVEEFDKTFPPKEKLVLPGQLVGR